MRQGVNQPLAVLRHHGYFDHAQLERIYMIIAAPSVRTEFLTKGCVTIPSLLSVGDLKTVRNVSALPPKRLPGGDSQAGVKHWRLGKSFICSDLYERLINHPLIESLEGPNAYYGVRREFSQLFAVKFNSPTLDMSDSLLPRCTANFVLWTVDALRIKIADYTADPVDLDILPGTLCMFRQSCRWSVSDYDESAVVNAILVD